MLITVYTFKDGYYSVGREGYKRYFLPDGSLIQQVINGCILNAVENREEEHLDICVRYEKLNKTLEEYFRGN